MGISQTVGQRIRNYRTQNNLSQEELAERAGCHYTYIGQVERGEKNATLESIDKIATALEIPLSQLFECLGGKTSDENNYAHLSYELIASQKPKAQKQLYEIILSIKEYKDI